MFKIDSTCTHEESIPKSKLSYKNSNIHISKSPREIGIIKYPLLIDKNLYIICVIRDPRDTVCSSHGRHPNAYYASLKFWILFVMMYHKLKKHPRFISIRYEDFVKDPDKVQVELASKIPFLEVKYKFSEYHLYANPNLDVQLALKNVRPIRGDSIGVWKQHLPRIKQQVNNHGNITSSLVQFGYENSESWESVFDNVIPIEFDTVTGEYWAKNYRVKNFSRSVYAGFKAIIEKFGVNPDLVLQTIRTLFS